VISVQEWAEIRHLHFAEGLSERAIADCVGVARGTVRRALAAEAPPRFSRPPAPSAFDPFEARVRALLVQFPLMPASVIAERVGWVGSASWFRKRVALLRPEYAPKDPADRLAHLPGDQAQCDLWFPPASIPLGVGQVGSPPVLVIAASFSRFVTARMLPTRTTPDLLGGMWSLLSEQLGAVPKRLLWDNETGIGRRGRLADGVAGFCGTLATRLVQLKPFDPESKGVVERINGFFETSFLPGRSFTSPADFNAQLDQWLPRANQRRVRTLRARPVDLLEQDRAAMLALPPVAPPVGHRTRIRLGRDYFVRVAGSDYSVDPTVIGRMVDATADLEAVTITADGRLVGRHARSWVSAATVIDPAHAESAARLRAAFQQPSSREDPLRRDLADYDRAFGVNLDGQVA
jgi:hypothetical protein